MTGDLTETRNQIFETARSVARSGALSISGHGNISLRVPGRDEILYTAAGALTDLPESAIARVHLDGTVLEGEVPPVAAAVIQMHTAIYKQRPDTGCVIHTHSPFATAFAVANRPIEGWTEAFGIFGLETVPVAAYGPRGSELAVQNIIRALEGVRTRAVLLANHGVLSFHETAAQAVMVGVIVEEAAQAAIYAGGIGGAKAVPAELLHASAERAARFEASGTRRA